MDKISNEIIWVLGPTYFGQNLWFFFVVVIFKDRNMFWLKCLRLLCITPQTHSFMMPCLTLFEEEELMFVSAEVIKGNGKLISQVVKVWVEQYEKDSKPAMVGLLMMLFEVS